MAKIKEIYIERYGPLPQTGRIQLGDFNLFLGQNGMGKTLIIDALVKLLLGPRKGIRDFQDIKRVDEKPKGYVIMEDDRGKEIKLPEKGNLTKIIDLTPSECRNIFIVRNSDLSIGRDMSQERGFYDNVTDKLITGSKIKEISEIKGKLEGKGKITPTTRELKDDAESGYLKRRVEGAKELCKEIDGLSKDIEQRGFDELEREKADVEREIGGLEEAKIREKYEKGKETLEGLRCDLEKYNKLKNYNVDDVKVSKELEEEREKVGFLDERIRELDKEVRPGLKTSDIKEEKGERRKKAKLFSTMGIIFSILCGISLLGIILNPSPTLYVLFVMSLVLALVSWLFKSHFAKAKAKLARAWEQNKEVLSKVGMDTENVREASSDIQKFHELYSRRSEKLNEVKRKKGKLEKGISRLKGMLEGSIQEKEKSLKSLLGQKSKELKDDLTYWEEDLVKKIEEHRGKTLDIGYDEEREKELKDKLKEMEKEKEGFLRRMWGVQLKAKEILGKHLYCETSMELKAIKKELEGFTNANEKEREKTLQLIEIFEEIEREEKEEFAGLFGKESPVSSYFKDITDNLYEEVNFNQERGGIEVIKDGKVLEAEKLSGGEYDQLYFSIRLALGEKLLKGSKGFFIMDDPLVKADPQRTRKQIDILKMISQKGWQIVYFSAKQEIKDILERDINKGAVKYIPLFGF